MRGLSPRQAEVLSFIESYIEKNSAPPTLREIGEYFDFSDKAAWDVIEALIKKDRLERSDGHRAIRLRSDERLHRETKRIDLFYGPFTEETLKNSAPSSIFIEKAKVEGEDFFALSVNSYSMVNSGIIPGDIAILSRDIKSISDNDIVLASPSDAYGYEMELRRFRKTPFFSELWPENDSMGIIKAPEFTFYGKLLYIFRSYV